MKQRLIILNLISILVVAFGLTTFLHEFAHAIAAKLGDVNPTLFHTYVSFDNSTTPLSHELFILSSGPLVSFFQAILFFSLLRKKSKIDLIGCFYLWMEIIGMLVFLGYIMMGPFIPYGDTGKIYSLLATPTYVSFSLAALALITIILFFRKRAPLFIDFLSDLRNISGLEKSTSFFKFFILPLLVSTIINTLISLPAPTMVSIAFPLFLPLTMIPTAIRIGTSDWGFVKKSTGETAFSRITYWPIISMILIIIISRILERGINL
ncbi:MAG: hypothetical protein R8P61_37340 [Bacteroidia bacterium]|nr:hypothetical protein [Bacteroidia bacterium]